MAKGKYFSPNFILNLCCGIKPAHHLKNVGEVSMRTSKFFNNKNRLQFCLTTAALIFALGTIELYAQPPKSESEKSPTAGKTARESSSTSKKINGNGDRAITDEERETLRREDSSEGDAALLPFMNNFFTSTRLGPEDVINVDVFDQPIYSRGNITVPPSGRINYPLIGQVLIVGRTPEEIEKEITEKLEEYIIDPKVTVQIVQVRSLKYTVVGDVSSPGVYEMTRRMTVTEGLAKSGYFNKYGKGSDVSVLRMQPDGNPMQIKVNMESIQKGKSKDIFLAPGDTVFVPSNVWKRIDQVFPLATLIAWFWSVK
jgi:polysaccharide biosynthesis/export protein